MRYSRICCYIPLEAEFSALKYFIDINEKRLGAWNIITVAMFQEIPYTNKCYHRTICFTTVTIKHKNNLAA